jgi:hypothetical protein
MITVRKTGAAPAGGHQAGLLQTSEPGVLPGISLRLGSEAASPVARRQDLAMRRTT